ncbi:hypothetical protein PROFUN_13147 [Planoprotostelium fungivorum]|uniref:Vitamin K epoxide reductase domain-containing protein n=1 Tax=Planoprotostelium fungivorum TaxID=1890364 RepID=A0A2P6N559_9EUKA|nr:hypothetical protein PROFUN_13147 [Planoprotostelium fungivorum]
MPHIKTKFRSNLIVSILLCVIGLCISLYLIHEHYAEPKNPGEAMCDINAYVSCTAVTRSEWAYMFGVPLSIFGASWYITLLYISFKIANMTVSPEIIPWTVCHFVWSSVGLGSVFYFIYAEYRVGAICPACTIVHVLVISNVAVSWMMNRNLNQTITIDLAYKSMYVLRKMIYTVIAAHILIIVLLNLQPGVPAAKLEKFTQCMTDNGVSVWGADGCISCQRQKQIFGDSFSNLRYINCETRQAECEAEKITDTPTWVKKREGKEERVLGFQSFSRLEEFSGCRL